MYVVIHSFEPLCGCSGESITLGTFKRVESARAALRKAINAELSRDTYSAAFTGEEGEEKEAIRLLMSGALGAEDAFDFSDCADYWTEYWKPNHHHVYLTEEFFGCGSANNRYTVERVRLR